MQYLDFDKLEAIDPAEFLARSPFPHANPQGLLTDEGFEKLLHNMPDISMFEKIFNYRRLGGQESIAEGRLVRLAVLDRAAQDPIGLFIEQ